MKKISSKASILIIIGGMLATLGNVIYIGIGLLELGADWLILLTLLISLVVLALGILIRVNSKKTKMFSALALILSIFYFVFSGSISFGLLIAGNDFITIILLPLMYFVGFVTTFAGSVIGLLYKKS